jgi:hypothetical protein
MLINISQILLFTPQADRSPPISHQKLNGNQKIANMGYSEYRREKSTKIGENVKKSIKMGIAFAAI